LDINILLTIAFGLGVPLIIFFITYKKTVGASKEREKTAYREIVSLIAKLIAHEEIKPNFDIINGLIKSKAREYKVNLDVSYIPPIFEDVLAKFIENEFISQNVKKNLIDKVQLTQKEIFEAKETKEATVSEKEVLFHEIDKLILSPLLAILIPLLILFVAIFQAISARETVVLPTLSYSKEIIIVALIAILMIIIFTVILYYLKNEEIKYKERKNMKYGVTIFEDIVFAALVNAFPNGDIMKNVILNNGKEVDFLLTINDEKIPIEVKYHTVLLKSVKIFKDIMVKSNINKAILITNSSVNPKVRKFTDENNIYLIDKVQSEEDIVNKFKIFILKTFAPELGK